MSSNNNDSSNGSNRYRNAGTDLDDDLERLRGRLRGLEETVRGVDQALTEIESAVEELPASGGEGGAVPDEALERIERTRRHVELASSPAHVAGIETGTHQDESAHPYGNWGVIATATEPVHWRTASVHAADSGTVRLGVFEMDYERDATYTLGEGVATRELDVDEGEQTVHPEITLPAGTHFITRDSEDPTADTVVPLKRVREGVDWDAMNDGHEIPLTFEESWQVGRQPGTNEFEQLRSEGWDRVLHNWAEWEVGFGVGTQTDEGA